MSTLPPEIITEILLRLPVKPVLRFLCVSKAWYALINSPDFINMHLELSIAANREKTLIVLRSQVSPPLDSFSLCFKDDDGRLDRAAVKICPPLPGPIHFPYKIVGYCNGLVCIRNFYDIAIAIWNPLIRRYKKLPIRWIRNAHHFRGLAFGHDPVNDDYKVMMVTEFVTDYESPDSDSDIMAFEVKIYSLRANSCKRVKEKWPAKSSPQTRSVSLNGAFHWLVVSSTGSIFAFDLSTEKFRQYTIPPNIRDGYSRPELVVLKGCICVSDFVASLNVNDVWMMKEYGVVSSWTKLYSIGQAAVPWTLKHCNPLVYSKDGNKVLMVQHWQYLFWYDIEEKSVCRVEFSKMPLWFDTAICVGSLLLLDGDSIDTNEEKRKRKIKAAGYGGCVKRSQRRKR